jgi:Putative auto-transporter adhesin, head GIN domain
MLRLATALCVSLLLPIAACDPSVRGNGQPALEMRSLDGFAEVDSKGSLDVRIEQGDVFSVAVNIDSNLVPLIETRVVGSTLLVSSHQHFDTRLPGPHVSVKMPTVAGAFLSGSGRTALVSVHENRPLTLRLSGSGNIDFTGSAPAVDVDLSGSGDVSLAGSTERLSADLSGSGAIDAANLIAGSGSIRLSGSGNIRATINGPADVSLGGSGEIDLYGDVVLQRSSKSGSGEIRVH